ncbi:MAG: site-2 protease family protein [Actinomycetota bacterium]|nr:site-2 protease family protein [Actinomycetota bacterium]
MRSEITTPLELLRFEPLAFLLLAAALVLAIALHEFAHALAADLQGDRLPRAMGRVSLNPARHLDPLGTLLIFLVGFGWGKPVEFRRQALSSQRFGAAIVALAGPFMNVVLAIIAGLGLALHAQIDFGRSAEIFLEVFLSINVLLAVLNLLPLPPLDGSRLLTIFLPPSKQHILFFLDRYGIIILLLLVILGGSVLLEPLISAADSFIRNLVGI